MGEAIHSGFHRRRSHLKSKTVDTLLKIMSLCADDPNSLPIDSDAINSGVRRNDSENELVKDKSAGVVLGLEESMLVDDEVGSLVVKEPQKGNVDEAKGFDEHITNENLEPIGRHTEDMQVAGEHQQEETCLAEPVNLDASVTVLTDTGIENVVNEVAGEHPLEETCLTEQVNLDSAASLLTDMDMEDGEIPDNFGLYNELVDLIHEDIALNEEKSGAEDQSHHEVIKESEIEAQRKDDWGAVEKYMSSTCTPEEILMKKNKRKLDRDYAVGIGNRNLKRDDLLLRAGNGGKEIEEAPAKKARLSNRNLEQVGNGGRENSEAKVAATTKEVEICKRKLERGYDDDWLQDAGTSGREIGEAEVAEKTKKSKKAGEKRSRVVTKERKEKKKMNERKKRAQMRREQGVKRLRIEPQIPKPKPPKYCEFYLKGRCQKGDSCKFSHDTTPLTKSQPCKFLPLQQCLKGDDCPFDHELSKYPCNNFATNGSCFRGDKCLFSHKIVETPKPSDVSPTEAVSQPSTNNLHTKRSQNSNNVSSGASLKTPSRTGSEIHKNPELSVLEKLRSPAQPPKGVALLSFGNSPSNNSNVRPPAQPPKGVTLLSFGSSPPNKSSIKPAAQPPKGVTLLSFGNSPLNNSSNTANSNSTEVSSKIDQETLKMPRSSNQLFQKTTPSTPASSASQGSQNPLQNSQNKNPAQSSPLSSALSFAAKYESEMMKNRSKLPTGLSTTTTTTNANSGKTPSSSAAASSSTDNFQNRLLKASPLVQEFLFGFDGKL